MPTDERPTGTGPGLPDEGGPTAAAPADHVALEPQRAANDGPRGAERPAQQSGQRPAQQQEKDPARGSRTGGLWAGLIVFGVLLVLLVVFISQNTETTTVRFLGFEGRAPLAVALLIATAAGILLTALVGTLRIVQLKHRARVQAKQRR